MNKNRQYIYYQEQYPKNKNNDLNKGKYEFNKENYFKYKNNESSDQDNNYILLYPPFNNDINFKNKKNEIQNYNVYNDNSIRNNYSNNFLINRKERNKYGKINIKNYYFFNTSDNEIFDEYIIDYKSGLNQKDYSKKGKLSMYNLSLQNWRNNKSINKPNTIYNKVTFNFPSKNKTIINYNNSQECEISKKEINKNNTYDYFYINNSKDKKTKINMDAPYKKRIINEYNCKDSKEASSNRIYKNKNSKNSNITQRNNTSDNNIIKKKLLKDYYNKTYFENDVNKSMNNNIENNYNQSKCAFISTKNTKLKDDLSNKINMFINHLSRYCSLYYFKIIKKLFSFLKNNNNSMNSRRGDYSHRSNTTINIKKRPISAFSKFETSKLSYRGDYKKNNSKLKGKTLLNTSSDILINKIKSKNESSSPNTGNKCEMFRNINALSKKYETITNRKNKINNNNTSVLRKSINDASFNSENKSYNEIRFPSVEKSKEKWETTLNKERQRKKKILEKKENKEKNSLIKNNNNNIKTKEDNITKLIEVNKILKNKIERLEKKEKKTFEMKMNIDSITIESKDKNNIKDFSFGDHKDNETKKIRYFYEKIKSLSKDKYNKKYHRKKTKEINDMVNIKKIISKDKRIYINMNYLNYRAVKNNEINCDKFKIYKECNVFNISLFGDKNKRNFSKGKVNKTYENKKYINMLTEIREEENKVGLSETVSQSSNEKVLK